MIYLCWTLFTVVPVIRPSVQHLALKFQKGNYRSYCTFFTTQDLSVIFVSFTKF